MATDGKLRFQTEASTAPPALVAFKPTHATVEFLDKETPGGERHQVLDLAMNAKVIEGLFRSQGPQLLRFLGRRTRRPEDAADMLQEAFLRLTRLFALGPAPSRPEAYLQQIISNLLRDGSRRRLSRSEDLHDPLEDQPIADPGPGPADFLEARDILRVYEACLLKMRPQTRRIFLLQRREGLTYVQIAAEIGMSVSGIEKHMMKAIAQIDRDLGRPW